MKKPRINYKYLTPRLIEKLDYARALKPYPGKLGDSKKKGKFVPPMIIAAMYWKDPCDTPCVKITGITNS